LSTGKKQVIPSGESRDPDINWDKRDGYLILVTAFARIAAAVDAGVGFLTQLVKLRVFVGIKNMERRA